jgi:hypothetical protein
MKIVTLQSHVEQLKESLHECETWTEKYEEALIEIANSGEQGNSIHLSKVARKALGWD